MNTASHLSQDDFALAALQLLPEDEAARAEAHLQRCEECRRELAAFQGDLAVLAMTSDMHEPSAATRERLLRSMSQQVDEAEKDPSVEVPSWVSSLNTSLSTAGPPASTPIRHDNVVTMAGREAARPVSRPTLFATSGWAVAACLAVAAGLLLHQREHLQVVLSSEQMRLAALQANVAVSQSAMQTLSDPGALNVAMHEPASPGGSAPRGPQGRAAYLPDRGALVFVANNMQALQPYKVYELWLLPAEKGEAPIPAASFRPDAAGSATVILPAGPRLLPVAGFGVTQEDSNAPPRQPTLPILLVGTAKS